MTEMHAIQQFTPFTPVNWETLKAAVKEKTGIDITSDAGLASSRGITLRWAYDAQAQTLEVQLMDRKWYDPDEPAIDQMIHDLAESVMNSK
ncbi:MAG TPA: hypothetical protein VKX41_15170 [Alloacidobacterium sp.]|jgi:hypothetical protein|nr:hypothetical protein [Alloacidobacterium sp.]